MPNTPYTPHDKRRTASADELRARIPGWGVDLDPADRPSVPRLAMREDLTGAHWEFPDEQPETVPRERSIEHAILTPSFGTAQPLKGLSGVIRRRAYARYSEARAAHWLLLIAADRVDALEAHAASLLSLRPDNPVTQTGVRSELTHSGLTSRLGRKRSDTNHQWVDPLIVAGPFVAAAGAAVVGARALARAAQRD